MFVAVAVLLAAGPLWSLSLPLKKLWTSSYVLVVVAISETVYALVHHLVEVQGWVRWTFSFRVIGLNSITIYLLQRIVPMKEVTRFFFGGTADLFPEARRSVLLAAGYIFCAGSCYISCIGLKMSSRFSL